MDLVFFVVLVGALVLVHELGHFIAARAFGVKVITFSLGFGPALLRIRGRETTYQLGLLPFGGFVRLLEAPQATHDRDDEPLPPLPPGDVSRSYDAQPIAKRMLIALAGPTMNVLVPLFLFFAVFLDAGKQMPPLVGVVVAGSPAEGALEPGDRVLMIDGHEIATYAEIQARIAAAPNKKLAFTIARALDHGEQTLTVQITPRAVNETRELGAIVAVGRLGIGPSPLAPSIGVVGPSSPAYRAGLRTFDVITHVGGVATPRFVDLERRLRDNRGTAVPVNFLRPRVVPGALFDFAVQDAGVAVLAPDPIDPDRQVNALARAGIETTDLFLATVPEESAEWRAGLRPGDRIKTLDSKPVLSWALLVEDLVAGGDRTREIGFSREDRSMTGLLRIRKEEWTDAAGEHVERYVFRSTHFAPTVPAPLIDEPHAVTRAARMAAHETLHVVRFIGTAASHLITGKLTVRSLSGPLSIYDVAGRAGARGTREFLWVMALVSINLGLLNLLPIPTLDGGQMLYLFFERVAGRPIPIRVREVLSFLGLLFLLAIMAIALRNDLLHRRS